jgi:hypothetical protein
MLPAMRSALTLVALTLLAMPASAKPDWRFIVHTGINLGTDLATSLIINRCMHDHGLGRCVGGDYGPFAAKEAARGSVALTITFTSLKWKRLDEETGKRHSLWWVLPDANAAFNGAVMLRNVRRHFGPRYQH